MPPLAFPAIDPVAFEIGPLVIRWYALAYLVGFIAGWRYCLRLARDNERLGISRSGQPVDYDDFLTWAVLGVILGGRLGYVLFYNLPHYLNNPLDALQVWQGGMSFHGGTIGVILAILLFCWRRGLSPFGFADLIVTVAPIGLLLGRIANFINAELYGRVATDLPWAFVFPTDPTQQPRHPSQLYQAALEGLVLLIVMGILARIPAVRQRTGTLVGVFMTGYGLCRFIGEFFREPDPQLGFLFAGATMGQLLSVPMILFGLWLLVRPQRTVTP